MELLLLTDALRRSSVDYIYAIVPYYGYARQDRRVGYARVPISARLVADMIQIAGVKHLITIDLHAMQIQGFFKRPVDNITAMPLFSGHLYTTFAGRLDQVVIVSPDIGGVGRARAFAKPLNLDLAIVDKRRPKANVSEVMHIIGDVQDKICVMVDDIIDTAGTLCKAADALKAKGAKEVHAYCTHPVLSGKAYTNLSTGSLESIIVTDTIPLRKPHDKIIQISIAGMLAETIERILHGQSISSVFEG
jgi:ribose-phosphate pyrophosphokinase